jgi:hypothetical protein
MVIDWLRYYGGSNSIELSGIGITEMNWEGCPLGLEVINLGENKITEMNWEGCPPGLTKIYLYDNKITKMNWEGCPSGLIYIDLAYNKIIEMNWQGCPLDLKEINLDQNEITEINWEGCPSGLTDIDLINPITKMNWKGCPSDLERITFSSETEMDFNGCRNNMITYISPESYYDSYLEYKKSKKFIPYPLTKFQSFILDIRLNKIKKIKNSIKNINPSENDNKALFLALELGFFSIVEILLKDPRVDPSTQNNKFIILASIENNTGIIELLLKDPRVDPSADDNKALFNAFSNHDNEVIKVLLKDPRVDPSSRDIIILACEMNNTEIIKLLLNDPRVDPSVDDNAALYETTMADNTEIVKLLLKDPRVDPSSRDNNALYNATENNNKEVVKILSSQPRVINSLSISRKIEINRLFPNSFNVSLKSVVKEKLFPLIYNYDSQSQKVCDLFKPLNQIELEYVASIYSIDKTLPRVKICNKLGTILQGYITNKKEKIDSCNNTETSIGGDNVKDIPARKFFTYTQSDKVYCEDLEEFYGYIQSGGDKNPFTGVKLADDIIAYVKDEYNKFSKDMIKKYSEDVTNIGYSAHLANLLTKLHYPRDDSWYKALSAVEVISFIKSVPGIKTLLGDNGVRTIEEIRTTGIQDLVKFIENDNITPDKETKKILVSQMWNGEI